MSTADEQSLKNAAMRQQIENMAIRANPPFVDKLMAQDKYEFAAATQGTYVGQNGATISAGDVWGGQTKLANIVGGFPTRQVIHIVVSEVENGRTVAVGGRMYVVPTGTSLLETIGQALVEAKLEN
jgi:hypothetical protein